ncbi:EF-hand calcium-binding domain-containing protein 6-like isoform X1 [Lepisosteus oculatus]|uniref:EF-hand calcium-binding domain-containing protein 6-like isoform X1 n=2 Tax=Lepisosteus oculatus TaxID=7918 RepID=UPI00371B7CAB
MAVAIMKRPNSHAGIPSKLPDIPHPLARLGDPSSFSVDGISTRAGRNVKSASWDQPQRSCRGEADKSSPREGRFHPSLEETVKRHKFNKLDTWKKVDYWINLGDRKMPDHAYMSEDERQTSFRPGTQIQLRTDELELLLCEKIKSGNFYSLKRLFLSNDPTGRGNVSRDALLIIVTKYLGRFISGKEFSSLLSRLNLTDKITISVETFCRSLGKWDNDSKADWKDPIKRKQDDTKKTATQAHLALKKLLRERPLEIRSLFDQKEEALLHPSDMRRVLCQLGIVTNNKEFERLWKRYDREGKLAVNVENLMRILGFEAPSPAEERRQSLLAVLNRVSTTPLPQGKPKASEKRSSKSLQERNLSLNVEKWLKEKLTEGFKDMMVEFQRFDLKTSGKVSREDFLQVLRRFQLPLKKEQLSLFLARCGLDDMSPDVDYRAFLLRYQDRSEKGMMHRVLVHPSHRFNQARSLGDHSTLSALEAKLLNILQTDFVSLLSEFQKMDTEKLDTVSQQQFRAAIETRFSMKMTDEEFEYLLEKVPLDKHGNIRYSEFLSKFGTRNMEIFLDDGRTVVTNISRKPKTDLLRKSWREKTTDQLTKIIKDLVKNNVEEVERVFNNLDEMNTRRLSRETLYQLLKSFNIQPHISREEVRKLWETLIMNQDGTLDFHHFVRHFVFSLSSACYPSSKRAPPVKGDSDFLLRSRKLNSDTEITMSHLCAKVQIQLDDLQKQFQELDPVASGAVTKEEFQDVLTDFCPELTDSQHEAIARKFSCGDNRISYADFLHPFEEQKRTLRTDQSKALTQRSEGNPAMYNEITLKGLSGITQQLRQKLGGDWKSLQQACKKLDWNSSGYLSLSEFRSVLKFCNTVLDEEEFYRLMSVFDKNITGKINYAKFIDYATKNNGAPHETNQRRKIHSIS